MGICMVRQNEEGKLISLVYGKAVAHHLDPIEKKPLFHFMPGTEIFSIGTVGCNFRCSFCQNWDISQMSKPPYHQIVGDDWLPEKIVNYCLKHHIPSIAYTYNEPTVFYEYAYDTAKLGHEQGLKNVFVSNGYLTAEAITKIEPYLDAINIDLKAFNDQFYRKICGGTLQPVLEGIKIVNAADIWLEITTLLIPGENDDPEELKKLAQFIAQVNPEIPWHISRFHPDYKMRNKISTPLETLEKAYHIGKNAGLKYVYIGNIFSDKYENTYCAKCDHLLIKRSGYNIEIGYSKKGVCPKCGERFPLAGEGEEKNLKTSSEF
jgi:pyruvate formate lyase activating enzyme